MSRSERRRRDKQAGKAGGAGNPLERAVALHGQGRIKDAEKIYRQVLKQVPDQPVALHLLGVACHQSGRDAQAVELIAKAVEVHPAYAEAHGNLGNVLSALGRLDEAAASYRKAIALQPRFADLHNNLGTALRGLGRLDEAERSFLQALAIDPAYVQAHYNLGNLYLADGRTEEAAKSLRQAVRLAPQWAEAHNNLGNALAAQDAIEEAAASYRQAVAIKPEFAEAHHNLGNALAELGKHGEAFAHLRRAVALDPDNAPAWAALADSLEVLTFSSADDALLTDLTRVIEQPTVRPARIEKAVLSALKVQAAVAELLQADAEGLDAAASVEAARRLARLSLLLKLMALTPLTDLGLERLLITLRRGLAHAALDGGMTDDAVPFAEALALQAFANEYVYDETEEDRTLVERLATQVQGAVDAGGAPTGAQLAVLGAYRPLYTFAWAETLGDVPGVAALCDRQIVEPLAERALAAEMPALTPIAEGVSEAVREQYEENPYPRWIKTGLPTRAKPVSEVLVDLGLGEHAAPDEPEVLVAGCGTGQQAVGTAARFADAHVLAVDLSRASLAYARRMTEALGIDNIDYAQADILELGALERRFDLIGCTGVLHHLEDPLAGWRVLVDLLNPGGLMKVALYSEHARQGVVRARTLIAEQGFAPTAEGMRACRADIIERALGGDIARAQAGDALMADLLNFRDFYSLSECRDLLFHVQEHRFTAPGIAAALDELGLEFLGFELRGEDALKAFRDAHPEPGAAQDLAAWDAFEQDHPHTFRGMYQFWCKKT